MLYILAIILIFFSLPIIGRIIMRLFGWWVRRKITSQARKAYGEAFGGAYGSPFPPGWNDASSSASSSARKSASSAQSRRTSKSRRKRIDPSVGEYVDYEEINIDNSSAGSVNADTSETFEVESQIVDVEWEDIR
ncbi:MAG: DUF4834 family protein [Bacteroides sp.]|nr:DUF4834 family protein [Bacteroides sp.]